MSEPSSSDVAPSASGRSCSARRKVAALFLWCRAIAGIDEQAAKAIIDEKKFRFRYTKYMTQHVRTHAHAPARTPARKHPYAHACVRARPRTDAHKRPSTAAYDSYCCAQVKLSCDSAQNALTIARDGLNAAHSLMRCALAARVVLSPYSRFMPPLLVRPRNT